MRQLCARDEAQVERSQSTCNETGALSVEMAGEIPGKGRGQRPASGSDHVAQQQHDLHLT